MLAIKLKRIGKKKQASFRVVVSERRSKLNGNFVEDLGWMNPRTDTFNIVKDRVLHWIGVGAKPTDTVHNLLVRAGVVKGPKVPVHKKSKKPAVLDSTSSPQVASAEAVESVAEIVPPVAAESALAPEADIPPSEVPTSTE